MKYKYRCARNCWELYAITPLNHQTIHCNFSIFYQRLRVHKLYCVHNFYRIRTHLCARWDVYACMGMQNSRKQPNLLLH